MSGMQGSTADHRQATGDVPQARLVFQQFPLVTLHKWAFAAAKYGECTREQKADAFWTFQSLVYENQASMESLDEDQAIPKLKEYAVQAGADATKLDACVADAGTAAKIYKSMELGKSVDVTSTPTLFINGRKVGNVAGMPYEVLKELTDSRHNKSRNAIDRQRGARARSHYYCETGYSKHRA